jgi:multiple sugar transport system ATP-binding protein
VIFPVDAPRVSAEAVRAAAESSGDDDVALFADEQRAVFTAVVDARQPLRSGSTVHLAVDNARLHVFDPATGLAVGSQVLEATPA